jgi:transposase
MANRAKKIETSKGLSLKIVNPNAAGIDISATEMQVCVPADRDGENNRRFGCFTKDLQEISSYLRACGIETVAMESTGIYWLPLFMILKEKGFDVILVNPRDVKSYSDKKTDEADAEWLMLLHSYGLLHASFQPENFARRIRNLTRHREKHLDEASRAIQHMQKALEQMNIKITNVLSDITGLSGMRMINAILEGVRNPVELARLAHSRCKASSEIFESSLEGTWDEDHLFELKQSLEDYRHFQRQAHECDLKIEELAIEYTALIDPKTKELMRTKKRIAKKNAVNFDVEKYAHALWGTNAMAIPGMSKGSLLVFMGELGHNFTEKFRSASAFCRWLNLVPNNKISGGKILSSHVPKRKNFAGQAFRQCANSVKNSKNLLGYYFRRQKAKGGHKYAIVCTAHKIAKIFFAMALHQTEFDEKLCAVDEKLLLEKKIARTQKALEALNEKLRKSA